MRDKSKDPGPLSAGPGISLQVAVVLPVSSHSCPLSEYTPPRQALFKDFSRSDTIILPEAKSVGPGPL